MKRRSPLVGRRVAGNRAVQIPNRTTYDCITLTEAPDNRLFIIEQLWAKVGFQPNPAQRAAILHVSGPLYLPAGPGSGKTRVLLWRTPNLIVFYGVPPEAIFLSTFTEKAARQLKEGLRALVGIASNFTGRPYDVSQMYVGTVHSLCQRLIMDRRFYRERQRHRPPTLLDDLGQYLYRPSRWEALAREAGFDGDPVAKINALFGHNSGSRHHALTHALALFNRLSEECLTPEQVAAVADNPVLMALARMYAAYLSSLRRPGQAGMTDFALLQGEALNVLNGHDGAAHVFQHVIVDEYQDTNTIQERLFFRLAAAHVLAQAAPHRRAHHRHRGAPQPAAAAHPQGPHLHHRRHRGHRARGRAGGDVRHQDP